MCEYLSVLHASKEICHSGIARNATHAATYSGKYKREFIGSGGRLHLVPDAGRAGEYLGRDSGRRFVSRDAPADFDRVIAIAATIPRGRSVYLPLS